MADDEPVVEGRSKRTNHRHIGAAGIVRGEGDRVLVAHLVGTAQANRLERTPVAARRVLEDHVSGRSGKNDDSDKDNDGEYGSHGFFLAARRGQC